ncbi:hypothetical protein RCL1_000275 [Eukaryota sp. TZLM3-RCL]
MSSYLALLLLFVPFVFTSLFPAYSFDQLVRWGPEIDILSPELLNNSTSLGENQLLEEPKGWFWTNLNSNGFPDAIMAWPSADTSGDTYFHFRALLDAPTTPSTQGFKFSDKWRFTHAPYSKGFHERRWYTPSPTNHRVQTFYRWLQIDDILTHSRIARHRYQSGSSPPHISEYWSIRFDSFSDFDLLGNLGKRESYQTGSDFFYSAWRQLNRDCDFSNTSHIRRCWGLDENYGLSTFTADWTRNGKQDMLFMMYGPPRVGSTFAIVIDAADRIKSRSLSKEDYFISDLSLPYLCTSAENCVFKSLAGDFEGKGNTDILVCAFVRDVKMLKCYIGLEFASPSKIQAWMDSGVEVLTKESVFRSVFGPFSAPLGMFERMPDILTIAPGMEQGFMFVYRANNMLISTMVNLYISNDWS